MDDIFIFRLDFRLIIKGFQQNAHLVDLENKSNVLAGIIQTEGANLRQAKVVVLSTGTKNIDADALLNDVQNSLPDTHAEVVARRAFMFYLYEKLDTFLNSGDLLFTFIVRGNQHFWKIFMNFRYL